LPPSTSHPIQLTAFHATEVQAYRNPNLDIAKPLVAPSYKLEPSIVAQGDDSLEVAYRLYTPPASSAWASGAAFSFDVRLRAYFRIVSPIPGEQVQEFVSAGGAIIMWPYLRETVASVSVRLGLPPFLLPVITVPTLTRNDAAVDPARST